MPLQIGTGFSQNLDTHRAAGEAAMQVRSALGSSPINTAMIFCSTHYDPRAVIEVVHETLNITKAIGCSTAGIIMEHGVYTRGVGILAVRAPEAFFGIGHIENISSLNQREAAVELARRTLADFGQHSRNTFLFFIDGQIQDNSLFLKGLQEMLGNIFPIAGAGSCDDFHMQKTFQFFQNNVSRDSAVGLILGGPVSVGVAGRHGWRPLGKPRVITKAEGNIIKQIDGKKASEIYREYFEDQAKDFQKKQMNQMSVLYPLGVYLEESREYLLRNAVSISPDGDIVCQGDIPGGAEVHIMIGNKDACRLAATEAAREAQKNLLGKPAKLVIIMESMARLKLLGRNAQQEIQNVRNVFGTDIPVFGMYSHGEICPYQSAEKFKKPLLQNEAIVVLAVG